MTTGSDRARGTRRLVRSRGVLAATIGAAVAVLAVVALRNGAESPPSAGGEAGVVHVHGLGVNPADGVLYAATHHGVFRVPEGGTPTRIADRYQDTMGFTVVGPDHFLASGHPAVDDEELRAPGRPPLLGLIESTDAARTWKPLSLLGEADFHALVAMHGHVYGFDATRGRFMVSTDRRSWEIRSTTSLADFAVDPDHADRVVAATGSGIMTSDDGGRTWEPRPGPPLVVVSWDRRSGLWGADANGGVHHLVGTASWTRVGSLPGQPQALLARNGTLHAAATDGPGRDTGLYRSSDGRRWDLIHRDGRP